MKEILKNLCTIISVLIFGIFLQINSRCANPVDQISYSYCESSDCVRHEKIIIRNMNTEVDPCKDFYSFACGGYKRKFGENDTKSTYDDAWLLLQTEIKGLIESLKPEKGSSSEKLKTVFENCMDVESSEKKAVSDAVNFLSQAGIPNWPHLTENFCFDKLTDALGVLAAYGEFSFLNFKPSPYVTKEAHSNLRQPALLLQGNFLLNSKRTLGDINHSVLRILKYFNISKGEADDIWKSFLRIDVSGIVRQTSAKKSSLDCKSTFDSYREVNCLGDITRSMKFLCNIWKSAVKAGDLDKYYSTDIIHIPCSPNHFHFLDNLLSYFSYRNDKSLANYLALRFFISHLDDLNTYFHLTKKTYPGDKRARTPQPLSRWEFCVGWITKYMNPALGYEYTQKILTKSTQKSVLNIIKDYVQELNSSIDDINWLDEKIKIYLQKQLQDLDIGFKKTMDNYRNKTFVESFYKMFYPKKGSFFKNILEFQKMSLITKEKPIFNSFHSSSDSYTMDFGVDLLQPPTFAHNLPKIWNYASLGFVIGHELSHNLKFFFDAVHLDEATENYLNNKMQCFIHEYSELLKEKTGNMMNSSEAKEEIIANNLGWELTEKIILKMINDKKSELMKLPCLDYTPLQLAYISFAQDSCAVLSKSVETELAASKPQNLQDLRILGVLQNSKTFSETFNCAIGENMNPEQKCTFY